MSKSKPSPAELSGAALAAAQDQLNSCRVMITEAQKSFLEHGDFSVVLAAKQACDASELRNADALAKHDVQVRLEAVEARQTLVDERAALELAIWQVVPGQKAFEEALELLVKVHSELAARSTANYVAADRVVAINELLKDRDSNIRGRCVHNQTLEYFAMLTAHTNAYLAKNHDQAKDTWVETLAGVSAMIGTRFSTSSPEGWKVLCPKQLTQHSKN